MEAGVLQTQDVTRLHGLDRGCRSVPDAVVRERDRPLENAGDRRCKRLGGLRGVASLRTPEMGGQDDLAALVCDLTDGGSQAVDAGRLGAATIRKRARE